MNERLTIKHWAEEDRPREKLLMKGRSALTEAELLAIILGSGNKTQTAVGLARHILQQCNNDLNELAKLSLKELQRFNGVGEAKAIAIISAIELGRRRKNFDSEKKIIIHSSEDAHNLISENLIDIPHEEFWVIFLKRNNEVIRKEIISRGGVSGTVVDPKLIFKRALEETASGIILAHNHPSGNLKASNQDIALTKRIQKGCESLDINLLDHLIITNQSYTSFADQNWLQ